MRQRLDLARTLDQTGLLISLVTVSRPFITGEEIETCHDLASHVKAIVSAGRSGSAAYSLGTAVRAKVNRFRAVRVTQLG